LMAGSAQPAAMRGSKERRQSEKDSYRLSAFVQQHQYGVSIWPNEDGRFRQQNRIIPTPIDQYPRTQFRSPMDMMRHGWLISLFHA
jgi:hypothetical protein